MEYMYVYVYLTFVLCRILCYFWVAISARLCLTVLL